MLALTAFRFRTTPSFRGLPVLTVLVLVVLGCWGNPAHAQTAKGLPPLVNLQHTLLVRKALLQDKELAHLNLGVKVENRVATLWGPVPTNQLLAKAVQTAKNVPDILEVRSYLYLDDPDGLEPKFLPEPGNSWTVPHLPAPALPPPQPVTQPALNPGSASAGKTMSVTQGGSPWQPAATENNTSFKPVVVETPGQTDDQGLFVLPAIAIPTTPGDMVEVPLAITLKDRVLHFQAADKRFQKLQILVEENRVYLSGQVSQWGDVQLLAKAIAQLPGVENVIIGQVQVKTLK